MEKSDPQEKSPQSNNGDMPLRQKLFIALAIAVLVVVGVVLHLVGILPPGQ